MLLMSIAVGCLGHGDDSKSGPGEHRAIASAGLGAGDSWVLLRVMIPPSAWEDVGGSSRMKLEISLPVSGSQIAAVAELEQRDGSFAVQFVNKALPGAFKHEVSGTPVEEDVVLLVGVMGNTAPAPVEVRINGKVWTEGVVAIRGDDVEIAFLDSRGNDGPPSHVTVKDDRHRLNDVSVDGALSLNTSFEVKSARLTLAEADFGCDACDLQATFKARLTDGFHEESRQLLSPESGARFLVASANLTGPNEVASLSLRAPSKGEWIRATAISIPWNATMGLLNITDQFNAAGGFGKIASS